ncbi:MAG TPA: FAD-dependent oxidoreductase [Ramlibacter sp.]|uniref:NAD(P)/FAD-dependent oxidoreductase n=1 Tax=Ramlibacter sp. TaxID=1917967 RepID=UPI002B8C5853|nr:FAD-dependent oxidoreductase [Ramlibacter sp.]HVZ45424.1 FAD-dependent oxidoreductase [Ramlibacter sp.]
MSAVRPCEGASLPLSSAERFDIVIVGAGHAGDRAAEAARLANPHASIALIGDESCLPYERPPLSKGLLAHPAALLTHRRHDPAFYGDRRIGLVLGSRVVSADATQRRLVLADGRAISYDALVLATGSRPRRLALLDGLPNVHYLRTAADALALAACLRPGERLGVVGGGFIGLEVAATAARLGCSVTVMEQAPVLLGRVLPAAVSEAIRKFHEAQGISVRTGFEIESAGTDSQGALRLRSREGETHVFASVVVGIGVQPNVELAQALGLDVDDGIVVDAFGRASLPGIYAAGEVTRHPVPHAGGTARHEFWQIAEHQAFAAGSSAAGRPAEFGEMPWFWSDQGELKLQSVGTWSADAAWAMRDYGRGRLTVLAMQEGRLTGAVTLNEGRDISISKRLIAAGAAAAAHAHRFADAAVPLAALLKDVRAAAMETVT